MGTRGAQQALVPGRVVVLHDTRTGLSELGVICGTPLTGGAPGGSGISGGAPRQRTAAELLAPASAEPAGAAGGLLSSEQQELWHKLWHELWMAGRHSAVQSPGGVCCRAACARPWRRAC